MDKKIKDAFKQVTAEEELTQKTENRVLHSMRKQKDAPTKPSGIRRPAGLALAVLLVLALLGPFIYNQPVSAVSIDSTDTTEIYFNRFNRIVDVVTYDENGDPISEEVTLHHRQFDEVMEEVLSDSSSENVYVTVASRNENRSERMMNELSHHQERMQNMHLYHSDKDIMNQARENSIPMGRMHAMHQLQGSDGDKDDLDKESTRELMEAMEKHHQEMMENGHHHHQNGGHMPMHQ